MPYKHIEKKIPRELDRRVKYDTMDREKIKLLHKQGYSQRAIAREIPCSRRYVVFTIYPERLKHAAMLYKERRKDGRYYNKDKWREEMKDHRHYKQKLYIAGKLK